jgi:Transposase DDE domain group 1
MVRQDTAGYRNEDMGWFERAEEHPRFGRILFTISADITREFRQEVGRVTASEWTKEYRVRGGKQVSTGREYAEVLYMSTGQALLTGVDEAFRFIAIREKMSDQLSLLEHDGDAPFPVMTMGNIQYKLHAIVTNRREEPAQELIAWHYQRCGKSEEAHSIMKSDFAGGQLPSAKFGANAAWWALMILSMNLHAIMKQIVLGDKWAKKRMKAVRFDLIAAPARIVHHARQAFMRMSKRLQESFFEIHAVLAGLNPQQA